MSEIEAIVCDFGGVLTTPLLDAFLAFETASGIPLEAHAQALVAITARTGANPLFQLETGQLTEAEFLHAMEAAISEHLGRPVEMDGFPHAFLEHLSPNEPMIDYMRELRDRGLRMAICTNNVREWEATWRSKLPVQEIFELVVDSAFVGVRKPDPGIYQITLERLGVAGERTVFVDDTDINCDAARGFGMHPVLYRESAQAIAEIEAALGSEKDEAEDAAGQAS